MFRPEVGNVLGPSPIDDWVEHRRHQHIEISQKDVHVPGDLVLAKTVGEEGEESGDVEDQDDPKVGTTGTQSLVLGRNETTCVGKRTTASALQEPEGESVEGQMGLCKPF